MLVKFPDERQGARAARMAVWVEPMVFVGALLVIPSLIIEFTTNTGAWAVTGAVLNITSWTTFVLEIIVMMAVVDDRKRWLREHRLDVIITVVTVPFLVGVLEALRLLRLARLISLLRLVRLARAGQLINRIATPAGLLWSAFFALLAVLIGATTFQLAETEGGRDVSVADSIWWAVTTATTVGYGDLFPETGAGRIIAVALMLVGIGFVALLTAAVAGRIAESGAREANDEHDDHVIEAMRSEVSALSSQVGDLQTTLTELRNEIRAREKE